MANVVVLMVAEKPMLAESIAKLLSGGKSVKRKGWNNACSVSEYTGMFKGKPAKFKVTSTCGHVMSVDFPQKFNNWETTDPEELYTAPINKIEANPKLKMNAYLASEAKGADYLVLWLDCDKEGENICFEVVDAVRDSMAKSRSKDFMDVVYRAHFSAITEKDIKSAMNNLGRPNRNEALSVDARQELDLRVGCSFTRFQTKYFQGKYGDLDSSVISYGPCQTPTLGFCVARHDDIIHFKPEPYWIIQSSFTSSTGEIVKPECKKGRIFDKGAATAFLAKLKKAGSGTVVSITNKESRRDRPQALNTVELLRVASSALGLSPTNTMSVAEHLYTQGYISYPRTETTAYPTNFDLMGVLRMQQNDRKWGSIVTKLLNEGIHKPRSGTDKGDHPPITPMRASNGQLSGDSARVYDYIAQHFIATLMGPCIYEVTTLTISCDCEGESELFIVQGRSTINPGFTEIMTWKEVDDDGDSRVPRVQKGDKLELIESSLAQRYTSAPGYLTESELISLMEKHGIGTDASIPVHINTICQRNYVTVESGRRLIPTKLGISLVHGYMKVDRELVQPTMRAEVEKQLNLIAEGRADYDEVRKTAVNRFRNKFKYYVANIIQVDALFEACFTSLAKSGKPFSKCGKCNRFMKLVESRPQRLYCPTCEETYSVPQGKDGHVQPLGDKKCPIDGFDLLYWQGPGGKLSRSYAFCPHCYNVPPFEGMKMSSGCDRCPHPTCPHSYVTNGLCECPVKCGGTMVLDPKSHPKWRFTCQLCPSVIAVFEGAHRVKVADKHCETCTSAFLSVDYKDAQGSPLPDSKISWQGCVFCEEEVFSQLNMNHAYLTPEQRAHATARGRRGRGRGGSDRGGRRQRREDDDRVDADLKSYIFNRGTDKGISLGQAGGALLEATAAVNAPPSQQFSQRPVSSDNFQQRPRGGRGGFRGDAQSGGRGRGESRCRGGRGGSESRGGRGGSSGNRGGNRGGGQNRRNDADVSDVIERMGSMSFEFRRGGRGKGNRGGNRAPN